MLLIWVLKLFTTFVSFLTVALNQYSLRVHVGEIYYFFGPFLQPKLLLMCNYNNYPYSYMSRSIYNPTEHRHSYMCNYTSYSYPYKSRSKKIYTNLHRYRPFPV